VSLAIDRNEECADGSVRIVRAEGTSAAIELRDDSAGLHGFENRTTGWSIAQSLRTAKILVLRDAAELPAMLGVAFVELLAHAESRTIRNQEQGGDQKACRDSHLSHVSNLHAGVAHANVRAQRGHFRSLGGSGILGSAFPEPSARSDDPPPVSAAPIREQ